MCGIYLVKITLAAPEYSTALQGSQHFFTSAERRSGWLFSNSWAEVASASLHSWNAGMVEYWVNCISLKNMMIHEINTPWSEKTSIEDSRSSGSGKMRFYSTSQPVGEETSVTL
jgi:hypothetical protein